MPAAVLSVLESSARRKGRKSVNEEDTNLRRARGEIACAECRRLKLKCDRKLPCSSCFRRGCSNLCPNGKLTDPQDKQLILPDVAQLHRKIAEMSQRIQELEDVLNTFQADHPLLDEEKRRIKFGYEVHDEEHPQETKGTFKEAIDMFGTLTIGDRGEARYFGRSGGSESLFLAGAEIEAPFVEDIVPPSQTPSMCRLSVTFPFGVDEPCIREALDTLLAALPPQPRAWTLCETYFEHATWLFRPIQRDELVDDILTPIYKYIKGPREAANAPHPHTLAVLYMVFAVGSYLDLTLPPSSTESRHYYHMGRAALSLRSIFDSPNICTIQAVLSMATFHIFGGKELTMDSAWGLISLGVKLAQMMGLHRDNARWNLDAKTVQRRRYFFWELFSKELFHCLALGRPPSLRLADIDCEFPIDEEASIGENGEPRIGHYHFQYSFTRDIFFPITELTSAARTPNYQAILDLDRKIRERQLPLHLNTILNSEDQDISLTTYMRGCMVSHFRSVTLLFLHRSFFAQAIIDNPSNPLRSPYAPSFLTAYQCAALIIESSQRHYQRFPALLARVWSMWTHLFSAAITVGTIVTRAPSSSIAHDAYVALCVAVDIYERAVTPTSSRARSGLAILQRLRVRANNVYARFCSGNPLPVPDILCPRSDCVFDELAVFGGQTRVLISNILSKRPSPSSQSSTPQSASSPADNVVTDTTNTPSVHPSLVEYLNMFPAEQQNTVLSGQPGAVLFSDPATFSGFTVPAPVPAPVPPLPSFPAQTLSDPWDLQEASPFTGAWNPTDPPAVPSSTQFSTASVGDAPEARGPTDLQLLELGMMSGESGMDDQWMAFVRDSGIFDGYGETVI